MPQRFKTERFHVTELGKCYNRQYLVVISVRCHNQHLPRIEIGVARNSAEFQALTPLISLVPTIFMVGCTVLRFDMGQVTMFLTIAMTSITLLNPIATVILVRPYRQAVSQTFKVHTNSVGVLSSIEVLDAQNKR